MATQGDWEREKKVRALIDKYRSIRTELKVKIKDKKLSMSERIKAMLELDKLPKSSSYIKARNRCALTHSTRSYNRFFGLGRHAFKDLASKGLLPGVMRVSW